MEYNTSQSVGGHTLVYISLSYTIDSVPGMEYVYCTKYRIRMTRKPIHANTIMIRELGIDIYYNNKRKVTLAPEHQCSCSFRKIKANTQKFSKILKKITDVVNSVSYYHAKNQLQTFCISSYPKKTKVWIRVSIFSNLQFLSDLLFFVQLIILSIWSLFFTQL